jgi:hypothetical protein
VIISFEATCKQNLKQAMPAVALSFLLPGLRLMTVSDKTNPHHIDEDLRTRCDGPALI